MLNRYGLRESRIYRSSEKDPLKNVRHLLKPGFICDVTNAHAFTVWELDQPSYYDRYPDVLVGTKYPLEKRGLPKSKADKLPENLRGRVYPRPR